MTKKFFLHGDPTKFDQVMSNIISNAVEAFAEVRERENKKITVMVDKVDSVIQIRIKDNACGISKENLSKIFDTMFTTKGDNGLGIGMAITKSIIENDFGGDILVESEKNIGTTFLLILPVDKNKK